MKGTSVDIIDQFCSVRFVLTTAIAPGNRREITAMPPIPSPVAGEGSLLVLLLLEEAELLSCSVSVSSGRDSASGASSEVEELSAADCTNTVSAEIAAMIF